MQKTNEIIMKDELMNKKKTKSNVHILLVNYIKS